MKTPEPKYQPVSFHFDRQKCRDSVGHSSFLVVVADDAFQHVNQTNIARQLTLRFNGCGSPAYRLRALADSLAEFETKKLVKNLDQRSLPAALLHRALTNGIALTFCAGAVFGVFGVAIFWSLSR